MQKIERAEDRKSSSSKEQNVAEARKVRCINDTMLEREGRKNSSSKEQKFKREEAHTDTQTSFMIISNKGRLPVSGEAEAQKSKSCCRSSKSRSLTVQKLKITAKRSEA